MDERRDTIAGMEALVALVEAGSFSAAAREIGLTPSAMSKLVSRLERRLGTQLVERTTRRMRLTEAGQGYCRRARGVLDAMDEAEIELDGLRATPRGLLRVTAPVPFGLMCVLPALTAFRARHADVQVELDLTDRVVDLVEEGIDVAVRVTEAPPPPGVVARRLCTIDRVLCASPSYLEARGTPRTLAQLAAHDCVVLTSAATPRVWHLGGGRARAPTAVPVRGAIAINSVLGLRQAALAGLGIAEVARYLVTDDLAAGRLVAVLPKHVPPNRTAFAMFQPSPWKPLKVRAFVRHLETTLGPRSA